ncbi:MAG: hypothetical protein E4H43_03480 [Bacteroidia bacterium]|nr:MAG: hypothetical protein E4H43_03480 [Bacteroidia bacterium]
MKKALLAIVASLLAMNILYSQNEDKKSILGINSGLSIPFEEFDNKTLTGYSGFAGAGANVELDFLRYLGRFFGLSSTIGYSSISFNENAYKAEYDRILNNYGVTVVDAGNYQVLKGMVGMIIKIPETMHTEVMLIFQLGIAMSVHPDIVVSNSELGVINSVGKNSDWSSISSAGIKINYWLTGKYGISLNYNLNSTRPGFHDNTGLEGPFFVPIRYQNINAGIVINI